MPHDSYYDSAHIHYNYYSCHSFKGIWGKAFVPVVFDISPCRTYRLTLSKLGLYRSLLPFPSQRQIRHIRNVNHD